MNPEDILICRHPHRLTVGDVRILLKRHDDEAKNVLADLILHRLKDRYITPLEHVPQDYRSGFLAMAACSLMIETFQCFHNGKESTVKKGEGLAAFRQFFSTYQSKFAGIDGTEFYYKIRCGILHQAQTQGQYRILRRGKIFDSLEKSINATAFLKTLKKIVEGYGENLRKAKFEEDLWRNARKKIAHICDAVAIA